MKSDRIPNATPPPDPGAGDHPASPFEFNLTIPDLWQQEATRLLLAGHDVLVDAPTGAGKTFIFELWVKSGALRGQAVYTVPTRALANDKLMEWRDKGWNVGISTGDVAENLRAPVLVATLETQKSRLLRGHTPQLIVIDEYQMIADPSRGVNYEMAIILTPPDTRLLLLSGSVGNAESVLHWMRRIGRRVELVRHKERPVPQEQVFLDGLTNRIPKSIFGYWPQHISRALNSGLGPILLFAPHRKDAERIARQLAASFPQDDPIELSPEQASLAGDSLGKLLRCRIAFHHSGLSYRQRAGLVEPLAKSGQLRVVVATTGLGAGINFSMRSVIISDREYRQHNQVSVVRPDELLQMFGRAGRRGLDERGYVLTLPEKPRLEDAAPIHIKRTSQIDWPTFLGAMHASGHGNESPRSIAESLARNLFSDHPVDLGFGAPQPLLRAELPTQVPATPIPSQSTPSSSGKVIEILASNGQWERRKGPLQATLGETLFHHRDHWKPSVQVAEALRCFDFGSVCLLNKGAKNPRCYGREWAVAVFPREEGLSKLTFTKTYRARFRNALAKGDSRPVSTPRFMRLEDIENHLRHSIPIITDGGNLHSIIERSGTLLARIDMSCSRVLARRDKSGRLLFNPPERTVDNTFHHFSIHDEIIPSTQTSGHRETVRLWRQLGLIDEDDLPTRRGVIFSFFNHGEGLAVAAALEDPSYPIESLVWDLANLRAGHRFDELGDLGNRLSYVCRETFGSITHPGYLKAGLPEEYGEGASDLVYRMSSDPKVRHRVISDDLKPGDVERAILEWRSILRQIAQAPAFPWDRWSELQLRATEVVTHHSASHPLQDLPPLTSRQKSRKPLPVNWR